MAKFEMELPTDVIEDIEKVYFNTDKIFGGMTKAAAKMVKAQVQANVPKNFYTQKNGKGGTIMKCLKVTRTYKTPTDDGINTKVGFYGYFTNQDGKKTPAPLVCNMFEYGTSKRKFPKHPFLRKSFNPSAIKATMLAEQKKLSGGILDE